MGSLMQDFKRQASFFLKEKIKSARLVLTDVTPAQIFVFGEKRLTEEITNGESLGADAQAMRIISKAAFEVDDYDRIAHILHQRLSKFDTKNWRASYKALVLLEHLLTHGPNRVSEEFEGDEDVIRDMANFHYLDDKGFDWGSRVQKKSERIMKLLEDKSYLKEERARARKLIVGIKGFGSISQKSAIDESSKDANKTIFRSNTHQYFINDQNDLMESDEFMTNLLVTNKMADNKHTYSSQERAIEPDHPFWDKEQHTRVSLLSST
ncbi:hypothetical protein ACJIZ3_023016 [Penstemon smallii]|uniref:ENTH domain-containing protein n=1 Tax=Penstemon smallii TaxID=265156 RepID=A0ABD3TNW7_9LAMI